MKNISYDHERVSLNLAILKKGGEHFELVIDPDKAIAYKTGKEKDIKEALRSEHVFSDAHKGFRASEVSIEKVFNTKDDLAVAKIILEKGEIQLSQEYRQKLHEDKKKRIIQIIHTNSQDPKTGLPHPVTRIENALEEAKVKIDYYKSADDQVNEIVTQIRTVLPISFEKKHIHAKIPAEYAKKIYGVVTSYGKIVSDVWLEDGSWSVTIELPAGMQSEYMDTLNSKTKGNVEIRPTK